MTEQWCHLYVQANGYQIDFDDWHAAVHGTLPYEQMLHEDKPLRKLLQSIDLPKYVFTNADCKHAETCLCLLGIADLFQVRPPSDNKHGHLPNIAKKGSIAQAQKNRLCQTCSNSAL